MRIGSGVELGSTRRRELLGECHPKRTAMSTSFFESGSFDRCCQVLAVAQRFEREAKTISSLNHPHICTLYDIGSQNGVDYLVMECVEGEPLAKRLEKGPLLLEQVLKFGMQIADALDKAHRN